jgi:hypothetical protein
MFLINNFSFPIRRECNVSVASSYCLVARYSDINAYGFFLATYISHEFYYIISTQFNAMVPWSTPPISSNPPQALPHAVQLHDNLQNQPNPLPTSASS